MKFSEKWLREWVDPPVGTDELVRQLTSAGLEVDSVEPAAGAVQQVVIAQVVECGRHPDADKLSLCTVTVGGEDTYQIVCGAPNVRAGLRSPLAQVGAKLPDGTKIRRSKIRGVESQGMLCSPRELGLGEGHDGILELPDDAPLGVEIADYLELDDHVIEIDLTPNRSECLGIAGLAREVGAINKCAIAGPEIGHIPSVIEDRFPVTLEAPGDCPRYVGRVIRGIDPKKTTPLWMVEKLRRSGIRSISPVVDITNYVMLELGQPMHAFDFDKLEGGIRVRRATAGEVLVLLDERKLELDEQALVIADERRALALAGIMGGIDSGVGDATTNIFLESAFFSPTALIGKARRFGMHTDASHRFERGVDPELQRRAAERATALLLQVVGGEPGPIVDEVSAPNMPRRSPIKLRPGRIERLLGISVEESVVTGLLERLGMHTQSHELGWEVTPPSYRFDITMEADLIEEIARLIGYEEIPPAPLDAFGTSHTASEGQVQLRDLRRVLTDLDYREAVTYSFIAPRMQQLVDPDNTPIPLSNPISAELAVMRTTLWGGLLQAMEHNLNRQQDRVRLFESGLTFVQRGEEIEQSKFIAGLITGSLAREQWSEAKRNVDFYDVKGDVEALFALTRCSEQFEFTPAAHPALHPGQSAQIMRADEHVGWVGVLHPKIAAELKIPGLVGMFELRLETMLEGQIPKFEAVSKFPLVRRDIAVVVDDEVSASAIRKCVGQHAPAVLKTLDIFDVYRGEGISSIKKSVALGLTFQASSRTLSDADIDTHVTTIVDALATELGGQIRN
ncbi:MAG: phenylalanine--tRNA ligase subunit beta [Gammaproteobacteria bacterium]|nr:phenylalanine--tRNA ligase subunit beta [Gammaproteobacteria bacterium]